jgi:cytosine/adenosine deaminase-related metal-dependent hydrolase
VIRLGYSVTRISAMRAAGIRVGFGVDGAASNDSGSVISDIRLGLMLHRVNTPAAVEPELAWMTPYDALLMATRNGAAALRRDDIGALAPGMAADVAMFRLDTVPLSGGLADPLGGLFMAGADARTEATIVNGRIRVRHGQLVDGSEAKVAAEANRCAAEQMAAASRATGIDFARYPASAAEARRALKVPA